jgi:hypothetical protein
MGLEGSSDEPKNLDLSAKTFEEFVEFFFARRVVPDKEQWDYFKTDLDGQHYDEAVASSPGTLLSYLTKLLSGFAVISSKYSLEQVDQAIWSFFGEYYRLYRSLFDTTFPLADRLECIRSIYFVYAGGLAQRAAVLELTGFFMLWDLALHGFWNSSRPVIPGTYRGDPSRLDAESRVLLDAMFETLSRILEIPDRETQRCALHGFGHLYHPGVHDLVQSYIESSGAELGLKWLEQCRDGSVL